MPDLLDVLIVGAGPAGAVAATVLARAGARVRLIDRATFPRDKLCGDTLNPGALAVLRRLGLADEIEARGLRIGGMRVTGEHGVAIDGRYPTGLYGLAILRRDLDWALVRGAMAAGAEFDDGVAVRRPLVTGPRAAPSVHGVVAGRHGADGEIRARVTIAADGRHSTIAFALGLAHHPPRPRRWAVGVYFERVAPTTINAEIAETAETNDPAPLTTTIDAAIVESARTNDPLRSLRALRSPLTVGEMHIRRGRYIGVAAVPGGLTNVCLVKPSGAGDAALGDPIALLRREIAREPALCDRFAGARLAHPPVVLGPLAVDVGEAAIDGLLLAGDAAGFIDPLTGDGLRFAIRGGELAAAAALDALEHRWPGVHARLQRGRRQEFGAKWRFNRAVRALVASPRLVTAAAHGARVAPGVLRAMIGFAGDCGA